MPEKNISYETIKDIPVSTWKKLSQKKIYFGHRSVGNNIIDGIKDVIKEHAEIKLNIVETTNPADFSVGVFAHSKVGENGDPQSKTESFMKYMDQGIGNNTDVAFLKYCFADIKASTDIQEVYSDYKDVLSKLKTKFPKTTFIHVTVPLQITKTTWKTWIKKVLKKKEIWEYDHNIARNKFNNLIKEEYQGKEPIFDLAKIESTYPDGKREKFQRNGKTYYAMVPNYTNDGGHLNEFGRKKVAEQLLILLATLN